MVEASQFVLGTINLTLDNLSQGFQLLDDSLALGINTFDTAKVYGDSEAVIGQWMDKRQNRDQVTILTKGCHHNDFRKRVTQYDLLSDFYDSLAKLKTDRIDIYLLHRDDVTTPVSEVIDTLNELHALGKVKQFGVSNWRQERIIEANQYAQSKNLVGITAISSQYSIVKQYANPWGVEDDCIAADELTIDYCEENDIAVYPFSSLARGLLSGKFRHDEVAKATEILDPYTQRGFLYDKKFTKTKVC